MIRLRGTKAYFWRNIYAEHPVQVMQLDLTGSTQWTAADLAKELVDTLDETFPGLDCRSRSLGSAALAVALALKIQTAHDLTPEISGVHSVSTDGTRATVFFACRDHYLATFTSQLATGLVNSLATEPALTREGLAARLKEIDAFVDGAALNPSTRAMAEAAERRDIPWFRISPSRYVQLGQGRAQEHIIETLVRGQSAIALELCGNKANSFVLLGAVGLPVGQFATVSDENSALGAAERIGYPVVLKPVSGRKGDSVYANLRDAAELRRALASVANQRRPFLLQSFFPGDDHRLLVVSGRFVAAARRIPASVAGDGKRTVTELVEEANKDPRRGHGFRTIMAPIEIDGEARRVLSQQDLTPDSVPPPGVLVRLRATANIATGGTAVDVTDQVHPDNAAAAIKAATVLGLQIAGVDFLSPDISRSWREAGGGICEVNSVVGLQPHWLGDLTRDVVGPILETIYPPGENGRIPTAMITGTKGKSTVAMMLSHILVCAGHTVAAATSDGVTVGGETIGLGDAAAVSGADAVLRDPTVTAAVLETARGGLLLRGMYLDRCDVAALLNVEREQIDMEGIDSLDDMARLKRKVLEAARRAIVLNADDPRCLGAAGDFPSVPKIFFTMRAAPSALAAHMGAGDAAIFLKAAGEKEAVALQRGGEETVLLAVAELPSSLNGIIRHNIANAMAAAGLALGLGIAREHVAAGLRAYDNALERSIGRFSFVEGFPVPMFFDRAAQAPAFVAAVAVTDKTAVSGRRICAVTTMGNRPGWHFTESAESLAGHFDSFVCYERADFLRGRQPGEIARLLAEGLAAAGVSAERIAVALSNREAAEIVARQTRPGDFVAVFGSDVPASVDEYREAFGRVSPAPAEPVRPEPA